MSDGFDKFVRSVHAVLLLLAVAALLLVCVVLWHLDAGARELAPTITDLRRTVLIAGGAATNLEKTLAMERQAAGAQINMAQQAASAIEGAGLAADRFITNTDAQLNVALLPELRDTIAKQQQAFSLIESQATRNLADLDAAENQLTPALANFNRASAALANQIPPILGNVQATSANTASTTAELEASAHDIRIFLDRELAPVRGTWNVIKGFLMEFAGPAAQVATAFK